MEKKFKELNYEISKYHPCMAALKWISQFATAQEAWNACERGDWLLWIASKVGIDKRLLTLAKGRCAALVKHLMKDERSIKAVEIAIEYGLGTATEEELAAAADAAYAAYAAAAAYSAADAAADVAYAAYAAAAAAADAAADAAAAYSAADAAAAYSAAYEKSKVLAKCAVICREVFGNAVLEASS